MKLLAYIPARLGSERVQRKNLRLLNGQPLIAYAIQALQATTSFEQSFVNTESEEIAAIAHQYGMDVHHRPTALAANTTCTDEIVIEFLERNPCDAVAVINPTAPFLTAQTIDAAVAQFIANGRQALFSVDRIRKHCFFNGKAVNFSPDGPSPRTQDLQPLHAINFIISIFDAKIAQATYAKTGSFLYKNKVDFFEMDPEESQDIDYEHEFAYAEYVMKMRGVIK